MTHPFKLLRFFLCALVAIFLSVPVRAQGQAPSAPAAPVAAPAPAAAPGVAAPPARITVRVGDSAVVYTTLQAITNLNPGRGSLQVLTQQTKPNATNILVYLPPIGVTEGEDAIQYTIGAEPFTTSVSVTSRTPEFTPETYDTSFKALFGLFVLAVLLENGLALLFQWKPYLNTFDSKATNAIVSFGFALYFIRYFNLDIVTTLVNAYSNAKYAANAPGMVLTALVVAGGSAGVNRIFRALGFRTVDTQEKPAERPPPTEAWISVTLKRKAAKGQVEVMIGATEATATVAGTISGSGGKRSFWRQFLRDRGRFPPSGGHVVQPNAAIVVFLKGADEKNTPIKSAIWGPEALAPGALVDIELTL